MKKDVNVLTRLKCVTGVEIQYSIQCAGKGFVTKRYEYLLFTDCKIK